MKSTRVSTDNNNHNRNKQAAENDLPGSKKRWKLVGKLHLVYGKDAKERKRDEGKRQSERGRGHGEAKRKDDETEIRC